VFNGHTQRLVDDIHEATVRILNLIVANKSKMKMPEGGAEQQQKA
jgi:hypothetical protein